MFLSSFYLIIKNDEVLCRSCRFGCFRSIVGDAGADSSGSHGTAVADAGPASPPASLPASERAAREKKAANEELRNVSLQFKFRSRNCRCFLFLVWIWSFPVVLLRGSESQDAKRELLRLRILNRKKTK
jgi:hypothetical protein